ncbi:hypothetical protein NBRC10512_001581 [Rhodotorula toruloides]|uniref:RHTO0S12e04016g1_1 n=2 Tax=Rhodotorula toruloides TaxID=5286 RepID=A0A061BAK4_RHOTO|nr:polyketide cyclase/dehydrase family protein [Rhodotorula toruloides NP11]KAJ8291698.1 hypothetical protein OF846_004954 [Rhodotorula toruloides]EMS23161.1 polyketide cyclase/dehydrase family protein [Rhodotorula toruloides NP11]KAK4330706.1 polyketide cyclase/dehydrase family protein [Rhodotorula toruloides]PRQ70709.1 hypothetical protein AAT19DRAFT_10866 [Rhodotorula toruloides]CDR46394.1 RHTO0S12e04016g1_1 [Rhodotorula toruloides]
MSAPVHGTYVVESAVIRAPLAQVWHLIKLGEFSKWFSQLESSGPAPKGVSDEVDVFEWKFKDGTVLHLKQEEHSSLRHSISYSVISAQPALSYSSVISTITLWSVTTGEFADSTFVQWTGQFSSDADASVVADASWKRKDALGDLAKAVKA